MLIKGITQLNQIVSPENLQKVREIINAAYEQKKLNKEDFDTHYDNSFGANTPEVDFLYDYLTPTIANTFNLKLEKANSYSRIYFDGGVLKPHIDRKELDLTLSIQIENTFSKPIPIEAQGYDNTHYVSLLNDGDAVLLKGRELSHWRNKIETGENGKLTCLFLHWTIVGIEFQEIEKLISPKKCKALIKQGEKIGFQDSMVLQGENKAVTDYSSRSSKMVTMPLPEIDELVKAHTGNVRLEGWQMLKYEKGGSFKPHLDNGNGVSTRLFTIIIYLNEEYKGGETSFTNQGISIKPQVGKLLIWKNLKGGEVDMFTMHEGAEVLEGTKYVLVNWGHRL